MTKITTVSESCLALIKPTEKFVAKPYKCPAGIWTIGYGTTFYFDTKKRVQPTDKPITEPEGLRLLKGHIAFVFAPLADRLCRDDLNQYQFDAVVDFLYNTGGGYIDKNGKFQYYDLFEHINNRMPEPQLRAYWVKCAITGGGKVLNGLITRRGKEADLFFKK